MFDGDTWDLTTDILLTGRRCIISALYRQTSQFDYLVKYALMMMYHIIILTAIFHVVSRCSIKHLQTVLCGCWSGSLQAGCSYRSTNTITTPQTEQVMLIQIAKIRLSGLSCTLNVKNEVVVTFHGSGDISR